MQAHQLRRFIAPLIGLFFLAMALVWVRGQASPAEEKANPVTTVTYDLGELVRVSRAWADPDRPPRDSAAELVKRIMLLHPERWDGGTVADSTVIIRGSKRVEVRTDAKHHQEIADLLDQLRHRSDLAVDLDTGLFEVDGDFYKKELEPKLAQGKLGGDRIATALMGGLLDEDPDRKYPLTGMLAKMLKRSTKIATDKVRVLQHADGQALDFRTAFVYRAHPGDAKQEPEMVFEVAHHGVSFRAQVSVTQDRRGIDLKLTEKTIEPLEMKQRAAFDPNNGNPVVIDVPNLHESSVTYSVFAADGETVIVPVHYQTKSARDKDRVLVLVIDPRIYIDSEHKLIERMEKEEADKEAKKQFEEP
jgi:hypothetical protein